MDLQGPKQLKLGPTHEQNDFHHHQQLLPRTLQHQRLHADQGHGHEEACGHAG